MGAKVFSWGGAVVFAVALVYGIRAYVVDFAEVAPPGTPWAMPLAIDLALFSAFALHHSVLARAGLKHRVRARFGRGAERSLYVWSASLLFLWCCLAWRPLPGVLFAWPTALEPVAIAIQWLGGLVTALAARRLDAFELAGLRTPADDAPVRPLEQRGLYGLIRHPIYLGWVLLVLGTPVMNSTRAVFAASSILYLALAVPLEERGLVSAYGDAYRAYQRQVRWRIVPGVF